MKIFKYEPEAEIIEGKEVKYFTGYIDIEIPNYKERFAIIKDMGIQNAEEESLEAGSKIIDLVYKHVKSVELEDKSGAKIESLDELSYYKEGSDVINKIGNIVITGIPLSPR